MDEREIAGALRHILHRLGRDEARTDHPFVELVDAFEARRVVPGRLKARSIKWYRRACNVLREECGDLPLESTDWQAVAASILAERRQAAWQILQILRAILVFGQRIGWRTSPHDLGPVLKRCRYQPRDVVYTAAEVARLLRTLDELDRTHPLQFPSRDVIRVLLFTGCRLMEIASLRREEWLGDRLRLRDSKTGPRTVPLCGEAQIVLGRQRVRDGWMFPGRTSHVSGRRVEDVYREAVQAAGLLGTPHALRHTFITLAVDNGVPAEVLKSIVGHTSTSYITANYYHPSKRTEQTACAVVANAIANAKGGRS